MQNRFSLVFKIFFVLLLVGVVIFRFYQKYNLISSLPIGDVSTLYGTIVEEPEQRQNNQRLTVLLDEPKEKILLLVDYEKEYEFGDKIKFKGKIKAPENFITDQGKEFDYVNYLRKDGIFRLISNSTVGTISKGDGYELKKYLFRFKNFFLEKMNRIIPQPESKLMGGLILGERSSFDDDLREQFINTGTIHIVALSGFNVTIVAEWIIKIFSFLPRIAGSLMGMASIIIFILMTGGSSTAIRAGIMASLMLLARMTGRDYDALRIIILTGSVMVFLNPLILLYDVSFQLSFMATIAVIFLSPKMEKYFHFIKWEYLRDIVSVTFSAYIFVLPFILYKMGNLSLVALPANILILPFIPLTMLMGFLTGLAGMLNFVFSIPLGYLSYYLLHYELWIINFFANLSFASFSMSNFPFILTVSIYIWFIYKLFRRRIVLVFRDWSNKS